MALTETRSSNAKRWLSDLIVGLLLLLVLLVGGYFRFVGQGWDEYTLWHPDERHMTNVASKLGGSLSFTDADIEGQRMRCMERYPDTGGRGGFFDSQCSPMNPNNVGEGLYVYGTLPQFLVHWGSQFAAQVTGDASITGYYGVRQVGRLLSALAEMGVVLTVFFIGRQLHSKWTGLLAALLYACTVFSIQQAHFWTADATANFFVTLSILFAIRVQQAGKLADFLACGVFCGAAVASRVNTAPVVGLLVLAAVVQVLPTFDGRSSWGERGRLLSSAFTGLLLAGILAFLVFRVFQPYAFNGPGFFGIVNLEVFQSSTKPGMQRLLDLVFNPRWQQDMAEAQHLVSGNAESPPNWQWVGRTPYLFPWWNMVMWGMGLTFGLAGWLSWVWSGWRIVRGRINGLRNLLPFVWALIYFAWLGKLWVMAMRYYLPIYPMLAVLAAWGLVELARRAESVNTLWRRLAARGTLTAVAGLTVVWGVMFTNIYRHLFPPAQSSYWVHENLPADFSMRLEGVETPLINIPVLNRLASGDDVPLDQQASRYEDGQVYTQSFVAPADGAVTKVLSPHLGDPLDDPATETIRVKISGTEGNPVLAEGVLVANLKRNRHILGDAYEIPLSEPLILAKGARYSFTVEVTDGPVISSGPVFAWEGEWDEVSLPKVCALPEGMTLADNPPAGAVALDDCQGISLWDTQLHPQRLQIYYEDEQYKRDLMQQSLDNSDYLVISTNRRYDTNSRIAYRWPMTMRFYDALFNNRLGFELVETFQETFELGSLKISDQYLPTYDAPEWLNEFEAEEAFHVYDHPVVFIFRKTNTYSSDNTRLVLNSVTLNRIDSAVTGHNCPEIPQDAAAQIYCDPTLVGVVSLYSLPASQMVNGLQFPPDLAGVQYNNGTWSARFQSDSLINSQPVVTILGWWLTMMIFGWVVWPLLFTMLPGLADRGYGFSKAAGLLLVAWLAWFVSSGRIPMWSQAGILAALVMFAALSSVVVWRSRAELAAYLREHGRRLAWIEAITLLIFVLFLLVRLTNPDLWHTYFGGEKPMDFAYFNGVLRSTVFPPIDPWHSGGYINYYYFGFVIVGSPVLLLGLMPSIAYNLIIPTLAALTGMGAFSVAFNVVSRESRVESHQASASGQGIEGGKQKRLGNPWLAGMAALTLAVLLGNLDTPRVFMGEGVMNMGADSTTAQARQQELVAEYKAAHNGEEPPADVAFELAQQAHDEVNAPLKVLQRGLQRVINGEPLPIAPNRWYWAPTRIISEAPEGGGNAIAEFPFFTFLYGDLHAHMIAMPMLFMVMAFILNEVLVSGSDPRRRVTTVLALAFGALTVGLLRATNTWDWITFLLFGVLGLGFAWWLGKDRFSRSAVIVLVSRVAGFVVLSAVLTLPYTTWFASAYNSARLWDGPRTQVWMYLLIYGLFLLLVVSLLIWETARWMRGVYVRSLQGRWLALMIGLFVIVAVLLIAVWLAVFGLPFGAPRAPYPVAIIVLPLLLWVAILFLRDGQSREMRFVLALVGLALALMLGVELIVLEGDIGRQNTVFKFYIQAWLLLSAAGGVALAWLVQSSERWSGFVKFFWFPALGVLVIIAALYPITATRGRALDRFSPAYPQTLNDVPLTLDGMDYMKYASVLEGDPALIAEDPSLAPFALADDYVMIRWLQDHVQGTPTIIEGHSDRILYRWGGRVSIMTGLPSVQGWDFHQKQQRGFDPLPLLISQRVANINAFYVTEDIRTAWNILQHYNVGYIIVSSLERAYYPAAGLAKFEQMEALGMLDQVFDQGRARVYKVNKDPLFALEESVAGGI